MIMIFYNSTERRENRHERDSYLWYRVVEFI
jgi:hypothetical protein